MQKAQLARLLIAFSLFAAPCLAVKESGPVTEEDAKAIVEAIEDEIYDYNYHPSFMDVGEPAGADRDQHRLTVYIQPHIRNGIAWVIYKLMPHGEVYRMFYIRDDGLAVLHGDPEIGFPPTQPNYLTVYMADEELCRLKAEWLKYYYVIDISPDPGRVQQAMERQKKRHGYSIREKYGPKSGTG